MQKTRGDKKCYFNICRVRKGFGVYFFCPSLYGFNPASGLMSLLLFGGGTPPPSPVTGPVTITGPAPGGSWEGNTPVRTGDNLPPYGYAGLLFFFFFFFFFLEDISLFVGPLIPLFWTSGDVCTGFQSQGGSLLRAFSLV